MRRSILALACAAVLGSGAATHAADIGGYFHEARKHESQAQCAQWIVEAQRAAGPELHYRTGLCYWNGWGVPEDHVAAEAWLRKAAERGHRDAQMTLGDLVRFNDMREAYRWYAIAAEANHPGAHIRRDRLGRLLDAADRDAIQREVKTWRPRAD
jgi:TPR repeat protein